MSLVNKSKNQNNKTNNDKLIIGVIVGAVLGFLIYWSLDVITIYSETIFIIFIAVAIIIAILLLLITWFRNQIIKRFFGKNIEFSSILKNTQETIHLISENVTDKLPIESEKKEKIKQFAPKIINYILWSNFRNWGLRIFTSFILGLGGIVTTILILNQNKLFESQNNLFELQNKRIEQQTHLIEADRRSAQVFIMGEVLSDINRELEDTLNTRKKLSNTLASRIVSLSRAMRPYRYLNGDVLLKYEMSPERGQLLYSLIKGNIDSIFLEDKIIADSDFSYAELGGNLDLTGADLFRINLFKADLSNSRLTDVHLRAAKLEKSNLQHIIARKISMKFARLDSANMKGAQIYIGDLEKANMPFVNLEGGVLFDTKLDKANLFKANLKGADLVEASFKETNLERANLSNANVYNADFSGVKSLDSTKVHRYDWLIYIRDSIKIKGAKDIYNNYKIDSIYYKDEKKYIPTLLKKNNFN